MARAMRIDREQALESAMEVFWSQGYEATSEEDLLKAMRLSRERLHDAFGDKHALYVEALRHYGEAHRGALFARLRKRPTAREQILGAFEDVLETALAKAPHHRCLIVNAAVERSPQDPEINQIVKESLGAIEKFFFETIEIGRAAGEFPENVRARETSRALLNLFVGLREMARTRPEEPLLRSVLQQAAALLAV